MENQTNEIIMLGNRGAVKAKNDCQYFACTASAICALCLSGLHALSCKLLRGLNFAQVQPSIV